MIDEEIIIKIDKTNGVIKIFNEFAQDWFQYNLNNFEIISENPDSDNEDFNDNARWITKTILQIIKLENSDTNAHCDWSADYDKNQETGRYLFITRIININQPE